MSVAVREVRGRSWQTVSAAKRVAVASPLFPRTITAEETAQVVQRITADVSASAQRWEGECDERETLEWTYLHAVRAANRRLEWDEVQRDAARLIAAGAMRLLSEMTKEVE